MRRLYNEYLAQTVEIQDLVRPLEQEITKMFEYAKENNLDFRDLTLILIGSVEVIGAEFVLRRAMKLRKTPTVEA
jgi:hypothetical protein